MIRLPYYLFFPSSLWDPFKPSHGYSPTPMLLLSPNLHIVQYPISGKESTIAFHPIELFGITFLANITNPQMTFPPNILISKLFPTTSYCEWAFKGILLPVLEQTQINYLSPSLPYVLALWTETILLVGFHLPHFYLTTKMETNFLYFCQNSLWNFCDSIPINQNITHNWFYKDQLTTSRQKSIYPQVHSCLNFFA